MTAFVLYYTGFYVFLHKIGYSSAIEASFIALALALFLQPLHTISDNVYNVLTT